MKNIYFALLLLSASQNLFAQNKFSADIRLNQIGFYPDEKKIAVIIKDMKGEFYITTPEGKIKIFAGRLGEVRSSEFSSKKTCVADFSALKQPGTYVVFVPGVGYSWPFEIKMHVLDPVAKGTLKAYYFIRSSTALDETYAGKWKRRVGHPDNKVMIHASAVTTTRPEGSVISSSKGWYDAGDYNKYIVNSGITTATLLSAYEDFPEYYNHLNTNIPESKNAVPDILDEVLWNLRWMLTMQDEDGGVYHKLTNASFDGMVMPHEATQPRYVIEKTTAATLDFVAVTAQAARVFKKFENDFPGLADSCLTASIEGWKWAERHPDVLYHQEEMNKKYKPAITTGAYGDNDVSDEFSWAAAELYATTKQNDYIEKFKVNEQEKLKLPSWSSVKTLGYYTLLRFQNELTPTAQNLMPVIQKQLLNFCDDLADGYDKRSFNTIMGKTVRDYEWGSSAVAANQAVAMLQAYRITHDAKYFEYALSNADYLLGRNATGYSFITGYGDKTPMHPHHRPSQADSVDDPIPGLVSGGPNPGQQDKCHYTTSIADESFVDDVCSYASNEIAINWNAPVVYLYGGIEGLETKSEER
jgi:endoglucanase